MEFECLGRENNEKYISEILFFIYKEERERDLLIHSLNSLDSWNHARPKSGAQNCFQVSGWGQGPRHFSHCFLGCVSSKLNWK